MDPCGVHFIWKIAHGAPGSLLPGEVAARTCRLAASPQRNRSPLSTKDRQEPHPPGQGRRVAEELRCCRVQSSLVAYVPELDKRKPVCKSVGMSVRCVSEKPEVCLRRVENLKLVGQEVPPTLQTDSTENAIAFMCCKEN